MVLGGVWRRAYQGHREVGDTTAEVTPAGGGRVGDTDDAYQERKADKPHLLRLLFLQARLGLLRFSSTIGEPGLYALLLQQ